MATLIEKLHAIDAALVRADLRHAFGGAIALAYCTEEPRGTRDLDLNVFVPAERAAEVTGALPDQVAAPTAAIDQIVRDGQTRLWWDDTPVDLFLNNLPVHDQIAREIRWVPLAGREIPVLSCEAVVLFKAFFDRTKDWADIEAVAQVDPTIIERAGERVSELIGADSPTARRLTALSDLP